MRTKDNWDFEQIFDRYFERVYGYVAYRVAGNREIAKDITQEVFLAALQALPNFRGVRGDGPVLTWLRSIARNKVADHFRAREGLPERTLDDRSLDIDLHLSEKQDRAVLVSLVMRELPSNYGELLEEKYLEDLTKKHERKGG